MIEKIFAKVMVNYESINSGSPIEAYDFLLGIPVKTYRMSESEIGFNSNSKKSFIPAADKAWSIIGEALTTGKLVGCGTSKTTINGLATGHAYSVLGAWTVKN